MSVELAIDPNVRVAGNETYAGFEDILDGKIEDIQEGLSITVREPEAGLVGDGTVSRVDRLRELIYISVDWKSLRHVRSSLLCGVATA